MASINFNFHATPDEARSWIKAACDQKKVIILHATFVPFFELTEVTSDKIPSADPKEKVMQRLHFLFELPHKKFRTQLEFEDAYPDNLTWDIGLLTPKGLYQSWIASAKDDLKASTKWKAILQQIHTHTHTQRIDALQSSNRGRSVCKESSVFSGSLGTCRG